MEAIREGASGVAVEDIQDRLTSLGYEIDGDEASSTTFGPSTAQAVAKFRLDHNMSLGTEIDFTTWMALVDECYQLGDRTLYLRLPNFHGHDVKQLQERLNILGFSCGKPDGCYGVHTESAVKEFQESQGALADGMAFQDTFDDIERLHHVWAGKSAAGPHPIGGVGYARAAGVLENTQISLTGEDPIARNVAGRIWNLATATSDKSCLDLIDSVELARDDTIVIVLASSPLPKRSKMANIVMDDIKTLPQRLRTACESFRKSTPIVRIELPLGLNYDGTFTTGDAQTFAVTVLDAICTAFDH